MENAPIISDPVMLDAVIGDIQEAIAAGLPWLDAAFGRAQRLTKMQAGKKVVTPNVYCGGWNGHGPNDYIEVSPDSRIGNFSFFDIEDPITVSGGPWIRDMRSPFGLVFWFDLRRVWGDDSRRDIQSLEAQAVALLGGRSGWLPKFGRIVTTRIFERAENIYRGYSLSEIDNQFLMHPFAGFRIEGTLEFSEPCL